jgi:hypothetical protein
MQMHQIEVRLDEESGELVLIQDQMGETEVIALHPDQVPLVCDWMLKAIGANAEVQEVTRFEN